MDKIDHRKTALRQRLSRTTRGKILVSLCRRRLTVAELAALLHVTDNAVRAQLHRLQRDGLVSSAGSRRGVRRPHAEYELTAKAREQFPTAYEPFLHHLINVLADRLRDRALRKLLLETGRRLIQQDIGEPRSRGARKRINEFMDKLNGSSLGIEVAEESGKTLIRSCSCPMATVTSSHPQLCQVFAGVVGDVLGAVVHERCEKGDAPRCCFEMANPR
jgi:DeoR family transcriptional regulator, suf operon transcriptional repressor